MENGPTNAKRPNGSSGTVKMEVVEAEDDSMQDELIHRADSPLAHLDPSKITNMVVDQTGLGGAAMEGCSDSFVRPGPPQQHYHSPQWQGQQQRGANGCSPTHPSPLIAEQQDIKPVIHGMDGGCGQQGSVPLHIQQQNSQQQQQMHMQQQGAMESPSVSSNPMTPGPQSMMSQQTPQTPTGQFDPSYQQQMHQGQYQIPPSPGGIQHMQQQQQQGMMGGGQDSPGMYGRTMMTQQQMMQQQMMSGGQQPPMGPMMAGPQGQYTYPQSQQQQQWAQQQQAAQMQQQGSYMARNPQMMGGAGPGQRVMIQHQRVPYPPGYPGAGGMQPQQAPQAGQFATRPTAAAIQRPAYPGSGVGPPQYPYPSGPPQYPQATPPGYTQQMIFRQQSQPVGQPLRPYMSPQGPVVTPVHPPGVYPPQANGPAPQTPQTPQTPYTPNGTRFPQPTPSPHYSSEMRSPPLMSPNQAPLAQPQPIPRPISNGEMVAQPIRMIPPQVPASQFYAHDPALNVAEDMFLAGCVFHVFDIDRIATDKMDLTNIALAIKLHGGDVDFSPKSYAEKVHNVTHVIADNHRHPFTQQALKDRKRLVTMQWLTDCFMKKHMDVPWRLSHLPSMYNDTLRPLIGRLISVSGFDEQERASIKYMVDCLGARMTPYLSKNNNVLIAKAPGTEKIEKAREWEIHVVNYNWLADYYIGVQRVDFENPRYSLGQAADVSPGPYVLEMFGVGEQLQTTISPKFMLNAWRTPVMLMQEVWNHALNSKMMHEQDENTFPNKKLRIQSAPPTEAQIEAAQKRRKELGGEENLVVVAFSGIEENIKQALIKKLRFLGGRACEDVGECTHLVAINGKRSEKLLEAIILGKHIVKPLWVVHGYDCGQWMDTHDYLLRDDEQEKQLGYNCKKSVIRARTKPVFEDVTFYVTPTVEPSYATLTRLIRLAGGKVDEERPDPNLIARCIETDTPYVIISSETDIRMLMQFVEGNFPIYTSDLVLMSILRQELIPHSQFRVNMNNVMVRAQHNPNFRPGVRPIEASPHRIRTQ